MTDKNGKPELIFNRSGWTCAVCGEFVPGNLENHVHDSAKIIAELRSEIDRYDKVCTEVRNVLSAAGIPELTEDRLTVLPLATRAFLMATASAALQKRVETARSVILRLNRLKHNDGSRSYPDRSDIEAAVAWLEDNDWGQSPIERIFRKRTDVIKETPLEHVIVIVANMPIHEQVISFGSYESIARQAQAELRQLEEAENILGKLLDAVANYRIAHSEFEATGIHTTALNDTYTEMLVICDTWLDKQIKTAEKEEEK
jgi:hypothetical protein